MRDLTQECAECHTGSRLFASLTASSLSGNQFRRDEGGYCENAGERYLHDGLRGVPGLFCSGTNDDNVDRIYSGEWSHYAESAQLARERSAPNCAPCGRSDMPVCGPGGTAGGALRLALRPARFWQSILKEPRKHSRSRRPGDGPSAGV